MIYMVYYPFSGPIKNRLGNGLLGFLKKRMCFDLFLIRTGYVIVSALTEIGKDGEWKVSVEPQLKADGNIDKEMFLQVFNS